MREMEELRRTLEEKFPGFILEAGAGGVALLTVVDPSFQGLRRAERMRRVMPLLEKAQVKAGIIELYTLDEAASRGVDVVSAQSAASRPASWDDAVAMTEEGRVPLPAARAHKRPRRIVFYSYKGGVGRTTALLHTAFQLARAGKRVAVIDLDVEAPGVHHLLPPPDGILESGLIDFLWERQTRPLEGTTTMSPEVTLGGTERGRRTGIVYAAHDPISRGDVYVVPAGKVDHRYIQRLAVITAHALATSSSDPWAEFERDLCDQFAPELLLIDARTGINDWGGLSLLRLADDAFLVLYPSAQNVEGITLVRNLLSETEGARHTLVLSPVPEGDIGAALVGKAESLLRLPEEEGRPIVVYYHSSVAAASHYPVETAMAHYAPIANLLLDLSEETKVEDALQRIDREAIVESLSFPERDARSIAAGDFEMFFQKTTDFDRLLDDARWVIRGRKGTGKSTLYHLFTEHKDNAVKRAGGQLEGIDILSGHGPVERFRPTTDLFEEFQRAIASAHGDWLSLWRAYAVVRLFCSSQLLDAPLANPSMKPLRDHLEETFPRSGDESWKSAHTKGLCTMIERSKLSSMCRDCITELDRRLEREGRKVWFMYDDLDQDIKERSDWQQDALGGLMRFIYDTNNQDLFRIRFKVFLREDIWSSLVFTNKSHFGESRTVVLQWGTEDFLRLAYRLATGGSSEFCGVEAIEARPKT